MEKKLIIIPTYNEKKNIEKLLESIFNVTKGFDVLIVDDNSPDKTFELIEKMIKNKYQDQLFLIKRNRKMGLATAYIEGFKWGLAKEYNYLFEMDADFSHNPSYLPDFIEALQKNDLVLGSRYVEGGGVRGWGMIRRIVSRGGSLYSKTILGIPINDLTGGFKGFRRSVLDNIDFNSIKSNGYAFQIELTYRTFLKGFRIKEIPIIFEDRILGKSKMSKKIFLEAIFMVWWLRFNKNNFVEKL